MEHLLVGANIGRIEVEQLFFLGFISLAKERTIDKKILNHGRGAGRFSVQPLDLCTFVPVLLLHNQEGG